MIIKVGKLPKLNSDKPGNAQVEHVEVFIRQLGNQYMIDVNGVPTITPPPPSKDLDVQVSRAKKLLRRNKGSAYKKLKYCPLPQSGAKLIDSSPINPPQKDHRKKRDNN
jgi:hypothetical protein